MAGLPKLLLRAVFAPALLIIAADSSYAVRTPRVESQSAAARAQSSERNSPQTVARSSSQPALQPVSSSAAPLVTIDLQDVEIRELVRILGKQAGVTVYSDPSIVGKISLHVNQMSFEDALKSIIIPRGYSIQKFSDRDSAVRFFVYDPGAAKRLYVNVSDGLLSVDIQRFSLASAMTEIARESNRSIVLQGEGANLLTISLNGIPFEDGLREIALAGECRLQKSGDGAGAVYRFISGEASTASTVDQSNPTAMPSQTFDVSKTESGTIRVRCEEARLGPLLLAIGEAGGLSVLFNASNDARASAFFQNVSPEEAIRLLADRAGFRTRKEGSTFIVMSQAQGNFYLHAEHGLVTLDANEAPLLDIMRKLAELDSFPPLVFSPSVGGNITIHLDRISPMEAFNRTLALKELRAEGGDSLLRIVDPLREKRTMIVQRAGLLTLELQNSPLQEVSAEITRITGANITLSAGTADSTVTLTLHSVGLSSALQAIAEQAGMEAIEEQERYRLLPRAATPEGYVNAEIDPSGNLSVISRNAELNYFVGALARAAKSNFLVESGTIGTVNGKLENVPFEVGLRTFLSTNGFAMRKTNGIFRISSARSAAKPEEAQSFELAIDSGNLTLNVTDADLGFLLRQIAEDAGMNLALYGAVRDKVNVMLQRVPLEDAIAKILAGTRFGYVIQDSTIIVGDVTQAGMPLAAMALQEEVIPLKYFSVKDVPALLPSEIPSAQVKILEAQNAVVVYGRREMIDRARAFLERLDNPPTQIQIEALLVEYRTTQGFNYNLSSLVTTGKSPDIATAAPSQGSLSFTITDLKNFNNPMFQSGLTALVEKNQASIRARPSIATISGREAKINVQSQENFRVTQPSSTQGVPLVQIQSITSGITLKITPYVSGDAGDAVTVDVYIEDSSAGDRTADGLPSIATRNAQNRVVIQSDRTAVIGGLIRNDQSRSRGGFPFLSELPLIGGLFGSQSKTNRESTLVFYITPRIIRSDTTVATAFQERGVEIEPEVRAVGAPISAAPLPATTLPVAPPASDSI